MLSPHAGFAAPAQAHLQVLRRPGLHPFGRGGQNPTPRRPPTRAPVEIVTLAKKGDAPIPTLAS